VETVSNNDNMDEDVEEMTASLPKIAAAVENALNSPLIVEDASSLSISEELVADISNMYIVAEKLEDLDSTDDAQPNNGENALENIAKERFEDDSKSEGWSMELVDSVQSSEDHVEQPIDAHALKKPADERPLNFLLFPNEAEYPSTLSRDEEAALITTHVSDFVSPVFPQRRSRAERRAAKIKYVCGHLRDWDKEAELATTAEAVATTEHGSVNNEKQVPEAEVKAPAVKPKRIREPVPEPEDDVLVECAPHMSTPYLEEDKPPTRVQKALNKKAQEKSDNQLVKLIAVVAKMEYDPAYVLNAEGDATSPTIEDDAPIPNEQLDMPSGQAEVPSEQLETTSEQVQTPSEQVEQSAVVDQKETEESSATEPIVEDRNEVLDEQLLEPIVEDAPVIQSDELVDPPTVEQDTTGIDKLLESADDYVPEDIVIPTDEATTLIDLSAATDAHATTELVVPVVADDTVSEELVINVPTLDELATKVPSTESTTTTEQADDVAVKHEPELSCVPITPESDEVTNPLASAESIDRSRRSSSTSKVSWQSSSSAQLEREVHSARNTYIGITSLEDFIMKLEYDQDKGIAHKLDVCRAFAACSADENAAYDHCEIIDVNYNFSLVSLQCKIKLGAQSLNAFLRTIAFDDEGFTTTAAIVKAFRLAAKTNDAATDKFMRFLVLESESST
jgi:hypothetical protein